MLTPPSYRPEKRRRLSAAPGARRFGRDFRSECTYRRPAEHLSAWPQRSRGSERRCKIRLRLESRISTRLPIRDVGFHSGHLTLPRRPSQIDLHAADHWVQAANLGAAALIGFSRLRIALFAAGFLTRLLPRHRREQTQ